MSAPLTIDQIVAQLKAGVDSYATGISGRTSIARDPFNVFELLKANTQGYLVILHWGGDENIAEDAPESVVLLRHKLEVIIGFSLGLTARPDAALIQTVGARPPLFQQVDNLRQLLMGFTFPTDSGQTAGQLSYIGTHPVVTPDGVVMAAYQLNFGLRAVPAQPDSLTNLPTS
jgi:hypothetical protein